MIVAVLSLTLLFEETPYIYSNVEEEVFNHAALQTYGISQTKG